MIKLEPTDIFERTIMDNTKVMKVSKLHEILEDFFDDFAFRPNTGSLVNVEVVYGTEIMERLKERFAVLFKNEY